MAAWEPFYRSGAGSPLVLLPSLMSTWHQWEPILPALTEHHEVLALTYPGHAGRPEPSRRPVTVDVLADDIEAAMDRADFATAHFVGNSLGGILSMELARRGRARSAVLISPGGGWSTEETRIPRLTKLALVQMKVAAPLMPLIAKFAWTRKIAFSNVCAHGDRLSPEQATDLVSRVRACSPRVALEVVNSVTSDPPKPYGKLGIPVLIAWAERDRAVPAARYAPRWRELAPDATWKTLHGVGHIPTQDDPELISRTILEWIADSVDDHC